MLGLDGIGLDFFLFSSRKINVKTNIQVMIGSKDERARLR
jgi:hypothetical protein